MARFRTGDKYGVYVVRAVSKSYKTLECTVCGGMTRREPNFFLRRDMTSCICDEICAIRKEKIKNCWIDLLFPTQGQINYAVRRRSELLGIPVIYPKAKEIFDVVGVPPLETDDVFFKLAIKKNMPPIPENFFWNPSFKKDFVRRQQKIHGNQCLSGIMVKIKKAYQETGTTRLDECGMCARINVAGCSDYDFLVGRKLKKTTITDIVHLRKDNGKTDYFCILHCDRCGKDFSKPAYILKNMPQRQFCPTCHMGFWRKNSAYFDRPDDFITPDRMLMLAETTSWFSVHSASPDFIIANAELAIRGLKNVCL